MYKKEVIKLIAFILLAAGTIGLLLNEFFFDWGRVFTLVSASLNIVGLGMLAFSMWGK